MMNDISDIELLKRCIDDNDRDAWEVFAERYSNLVWNTVRKTFNNYSFRHSQEDVEDMYGLVFLSLLDNDFKKLRQFRNKNACSVTTWLAIIVVNMTIDFLRKDKRHLNADSSREDVDIWDFIPDNSGRADKAMEAAQQDNSFKQAVKDLPPKDKLIYDMLYNQGFSPEETAKALGMNAGSIYTRKHRIIEKIKKSVSGL